MEHLKTFEDIEFFQPKNADEWLKDKITKSIQTRLAVKNPGSIKLAVDDIYSIIKDRDTKIVNTIKSKIAEYEEYQDIDDEDYYSAGEISGELKAHKDILSLYESK